MVSSIELSSPEYQEQIQEAIKPRTLVSPHPEEEGVFILERGERRSYITQGLARIGGSAIKYTYERPIISNDSVPTLLVPGYGGIKPAYKELRKSIVDIGKPAITFRAPRTQEKFAALHPKHFFHPERLLAQSVIAIASDVLEKSGVRNKFDKVDTAGHSMGGPAIVNAGLIHPELFRTVTAVASAGLDGHTLKDMGERAPAVIYGEILPLVKDIKISRDYRTINHMFHYLARNPWRTVAEGLAVGSGDIRDKVSILGMLGIKTAALQFENDHFFPLEGVQEHSAERFDLFKVFPDPNANHMWPMLQPDAVAIELVDIVDELNSNEKPILQLV